MARKFQSSPTADSPPDDSPFTAENYLDRAKAHARGKWVVIRNERATDKGVQTPAQWLAWMAWFASSGMPTAFKEAHGMVTVPAAWPEDFDYLSRASDRAAVFDRNRDPDWGDRVRGTGAVADDERTAYDGAELERRKTFIGDWRKRLQYTLAAAGPSVEPPKTLDARYCKGEMRDMAVKANLAHVEKLKSEYTSTPCAPLRGYAGEGK